MIPSDVRVFLAAQPIDFRKGPDGMLALVRDAGSDPFNGRCTYSAPSEPNTRHSAYGLRFAMVAYRWHPLFGRRLQVSPFRRGKDLTCIYTDERPDLCRELPNWMFDEVYCVGMTLVRVDEFDQA